MSGAYVRAVQDALASFLNLLVRLALPLSILLGLTLIALVVGYFQNRESTFESLGFLKKGSSRILGFCLVGLTFMVCWSALKQTRTVEVDALQWRDASEAVANPTMDAPPVFQSGPVAAAIRERTYTKVTNLPPSIGEMLKTEGVQALRPYLPDSTSEGVLGQQDKLEQKGNLYTLTRQVKQNEEAPVPFQKSDVNVAFRRVGGRAYEAKFTGTYAFRNPAAEASNVRFTFPLPESGTIDGLEMTVGKDRVIQPNGNSQVLQWSGALAPGESRVAKVSYRVVGAKTWAYDVGSERRRVEQFSLKVDPGGPVKYLRGSLRPNGAEPIWNLTNVVTTQKVALSFPTDAVARETFVQTLAMLPAGLALFLFGSWLLAWRTRNLKEPVLIALALVLFAFGLGGSTILAAYIGPLLGVLVSLAAGCAAVAFVLGPRSLLATLPAALFVAAFMSAEHTGVIVGLVFLCAIAVHLMGVRPRETATV